MSPAEVLTLLSTLPTLCRTLVATSAMPAWREASTSCWWFCRMTSVCARTCRRSEPIHPVATRMLKRQAAHQRQRVSDAPPGGRAQQSHVSRPRHQQAETLRFMVFSPLNQADPGKAQHTARAPRRQVLAGALARQLGGEDQRSVLQHQPRRGGMRDILQQPGFELDDHAVIRPLQQDLLRGGLFAAPAKPRRPFGETWPPPDRARRRPPPGNRALRPNRPHEAGWFVGC